jgi:hypothetical protein
MASTTLKMAVFAPMPSASADTATVVNAGDFRRNRNAYRRSSSRVDIKCLRIYEDITDSQCNGYIAPQWLSGASGSEG